MPRSILITILIIMMPCKQYAQSIPDTTLSAKDSMLILQEFINMLDSVDKPASYVYASVGFGNRLFSTRNNSINSRQTTSTVIYSPAIGYFHKSGFSFSVGANLLNDKVSGFGVNQYSISPAFELQGNKNFDLGISYTRYFVKDKYSSYSSPIQNDLYVSSRYKKPWLQPGIAIGYSTGEYKEVVTKDTLNRHFYDSTTNQLKSFSLVASAGHSFTWYEIFNKKDGLSFTTTLMLNFGSDRTEIQHKTNAVNLFNYLNRRGKLPKFRTNGFAAESTGLDLDLNYSIGKFSLEPQLYLDCYLPKTDENRFTQVFTFTIGYTF